MSTRRNFIVTSLSAGTAAIIAPLSGAQANPSSSSMNDPILPLKGRRILAVWGGYAPHEPEQGIHVFAPWIRDQGAELIVRNSLEVYADASLLSSVDLILQNWTMGALTKDQEKGLLSAVKAGCGFAGWHGGLCDSFRACTGYQFMTGGQWTEHPGGIIDYQVDVRDAQDPVTSGIGSFTMHSEQYYMLVDPNSKVLATTTFSGAHAPWIEGCVMPVVWKKHYGKGRVFYSSLGHVAKDLEVPAAREIMKRGIQWAAASRAGEGETLVRPVYKG